MKSFGSQFPNRRDGEHLLGVWARESHRKIKNSHQCCAPLASEECKGPLDESNSKASSFGGGRSSIIACVNGRILDFLRIRR